MRWLGTDELGGPTGAIVPSPDVAGGVLPVDLWTTRLRCPQIHRHRDHNSKAIFHLVAPDPITPYPPQIARNQFLQPPFWSSPYAYSRSRMVSMSPLDNATSVASPRAFRK